MSRLHKLQVRAIHPCKAAAVCPQEQNLQEEPYERTKILHNIKYYHSSYDTSIPNKFISFNSYHLYIMNILLVYFALRSGLLEVEA